MYVSVFVLESSPNARMIPKSISIKIYIANNAMRKFDRSLQDFLNLYIYKEIKKSGLTSYYNLSSFCTLYAYAVE